LGGRIAKSKMFRLHFQLSEEEIDLLLLDKQLIYKGVESKKSKVTVELMEAYPLIYGLSFDQFSEDNVAFP